MSPIIATTVPHFIALVDHLLGFRPTTSVVAVAPSGGSHARVDFPTSTDDALEVAGLLGRAYRNDTGPVFLFAFVDNTEHIATAPEVLAQVAAAFPGTVHALFRVTGDQWADVTLGAVVQEGTVTREDRDYIAAQAVANGAPMPVADRATHIDRFTRDAARVVSTDVIGCVIEEMGAETTAENTTVATAMIDTARTTRLALADSEVARLLILSSIEAWRAHTIAAMRRESGVQDLAIWAQVAVEAPEHMDRTGALHLAAFASWMAGDGPTGWAALDTAHTEGAPIDHVAGIVIDAFQTKRDPGTWQPEAGE